MNQANNKRWQLLRQKPKLVYLQLLPLATGIHFQKCIFKWSRKIKGPLNYYNETRIWCLLECAPCGQEEFECISNIIDTNEGSGDLDVCHTKCIPNSNKCDGIFDCPDGSDEDPSICNSKSIFLSCNTINTIYAGLLRII